jgi:hypothetical protein
LSREKQKKDFAFRDGHACLRADIAQAEDGTAIAANGDRAAPARMERPFTGTEINPAKKGCAKGRSLVRSRLQLLHI